MFANVITPIDALRPLAHRHKWLMQVLLSFADRQRECWPSLRTIAERAGETLSWVQRNLAEMESLGYFKRRRRGVGSYLYRIAEKFCTAHRRDSTKRADAAGEGGLSTVDKSRGVPPVGAKGESKKDSHDSKNSLGGLGRSAPSEREPITAEDIAYVDELVAKAVGPKRQAQQLHDEVAYAAAVKTEKERRWLYGLCQWVMGRFTGNAMLQALEALHTRETAGSRAATPRPIRKAVDDLDTLWRLEAGPNRAARAAERVVRHAAMRRERINYSNREDKV